MFAAILSQFQTEGSQGIPRLGIKWSLLIYFIPSFIAATPAVKQSRLRSQQAELCRVKSWKFPVCNVPEG